MQELGFCRYTVDDTSIVYQMFMFIHTHFSNILLGS